MKSAKRFELEDLPHIQDECGVFGMYCRDKIDSSSIYFAMQALQHRGQESAGIAASNLKNMICHKAEGLVGSVFNEDNLKPFRNQKLLISHVRYSTYGVKNILNAQPFMAYGNDGPFAIAHNGQLLNAARIRKELQQQGMVFMTDSDSEVFLHLFARYAHMGLEEAVKAMLRDVRGSFGLLLLTLDKLIAVRDPLGIRPLCIGKLGDTYMVSSESCAFNVMGAELIRDVKPGEMIVLDANGLTATDIDVGRPLHGCIFEHVYLARNDSVIDGVSVAETRIRSGRALALASPVEADLVAGVPDSALLGAIGYSRQSGIPYGDALVKNRYVGRTFIQPSQSQRELGVRVKLAALPSAVAGKRVVLVDDSIVRGTTSRKLVDMLRSAGAVEVHLRICSPPVRYPCFFGINTPSARQLISACNTLEEIRQATGADTLAYLSLNDLLGAAESKGNGFCTACFSGDYPLNLSTCRRCGLKS